MSAHPRRKPRRYRVDHATTDRAFDALVPGEVRHLSQTHWTPIDVAIRAAKLLSPRPGARVLDIGAGVGKLCIVGALSSDAHWFGVERHELLVRTAERMARGLGVADRATFVTGDVFSLDWREFDALYLYNPFELPLFPESTDATDHTHTYRDQVRRAEERLAAMPHGTRVVTLHGFGGVMPASYALSYQERIPIVGLDLVSWIQLSGDRRATEVS